MLFKRFLHALPLLAAVPTASLLLESNSFAAEKLKVLQTFNGTTNGAYPNGEGPLILTSLGNVLGPTGSGGSGTGCANDGCGVVFELTLKQNGWKESVLYDFSTDSTTGFAPEFGLISDPAGNLYGPAFYENCGSIFKLAPDSSGGWTENVLHVFNAIPSDACDPSGGLVSDALGNLYGLTSNGGGYGEGAAYELTPNADGSWSYSVIYSFGQQFGDNSHPFGTLAIDSAGNLYGAASGGLYGEGNVFKLTNTGTDWTDSVIFYLTAQTGGGPAGGVIFDRQGNLYGATSGGGTGGLGTVYQLIPEPKGSWKPNLLHSFTGNDDGASPSSGSLTIDAVGNLYGETFYGGVYAWGTLFEIVKPATGSRWTETILHSFANEQDGNSPSGGVTLDSAGNLYGTAAGGALGYGLVFEILR